jgi:hypothetical protein
MRLGSDFKAWQLTGTCVLSYHRYLKKNEVLKFSVFASFLGFSRFRMAYINIYQQ